MTKRTVCSFIIIYVAFTTINNSAFPWKGGIIRYYALVEDILTPNAQ